MISCVCIEISKERYMINIHMNDGYTFSIFHANANNPNSTLCYFIEIRRLSL
jgi:hypothetical protein